MTAIDIQAMEAARQEAIDLSTAVGDLTSRVETICEAFTAVECRTVAAVLAGLVESLQGVPAQLYSVGVVLQDNYSIAEEINDLGAFTAYVELLESGGE